MARKYAEKDIKLLWSKSSGRCAFPDCRQLLTENATGVDDAVTLGEMAHIEAYSDKGPRANLSPSLKRNSYENLILLCAHHHTLVDRQPNSYTAEDLRQWKTDHEAWVNQRLTEKMTGVSFAELDIITKALLQTPSDPTSQFTHIDPSQKMQRNNLTSNVHFLITIGLSKFGEVQKYVQKMTLIDVQYPERLKTGFLTEYHALREQGLEGDALFESLRDFTIQGNRDNFTKQAAGLAVLVYYFHTCEVFEQ